MDADRCDHETLKCNTKRAEALTRVVLPTTRGDGNYIVARAPEHFRYHRNVCVSALRALGAILARAAKCKSQFKVKNGQKKKRRQGSNEAIARERVVQVTVFWNSMRALA